MVVGVADNIKTDDFACKTLHSKEFLLVTDWRRIQAASRLSATSVSLRFSDDLMHRIGASGAKMYVVQNQLIVECQTQDSVSELAIRLASDIRKELKAAGCNYLKEIEFWHELTGVTYTTPVVLI